MKHTDNEAARRLLAAVEKTSKEVVAGTLGCTVVTVTNLLSGAGPSLRVALAAERAYKIPPRLWEVAA